MCVCLENRRVASWGSRDGLLKKIKKIRCLLSHFFTQANIKTGSIFQTNSNLTCVKSGTARDANILTATGGTFVSTASVPDGGACELLWEHKNK